MATIAILFSRFGPYHVARIAAVARRLAGTEDRVVGIEIARTDHEYAWDPIAETPDFQRETLFPTERYDAISPPRIATAVHAALDNLSPATVALPGWAAPEALASLRWCRRHGAHAVLMSESARNDAPRQALRELVKRSIVCHADAALVGGSRHAAYAAQLGLPPAAIQLGYDVVDNDHFAVGADRARREAEQSRQRLSLPKNYFLVSARFVPKKNLARLLDAFARYRAQTDVPPWHLVLCGDGPERHALAEQVSRLAIQDLIHFAGFVAYADLPVYYGLASAFVHASTVEQWGLVVNEALAAGLPVLVSDQCGCVPELVQAGRNGFTFDAGRTDALADLLTRVSATPPQARLDMAAAGRAIVRSWSPERFADGLLAARTVAAQFPAQPTLLQRAVFRFVYAQPGTHAA